MSDKIIDFESEKERCLVTSGGVETKYRYRRRQIKQLRECPHPEILLDVESMMCECGTCGVLIHPFYVLVEYMERQRKTQVDTARYEAAKAEFEKIWKGLSLTQKERRQISP